MANRYAPYKIRTLTREPRTLYLHWISTGSTGEQELADGATYGSSGPFNDGIVNVVVSGTGIHKVSLGSSATSRDSYAYFAGIDFCSDEADRVVAEVTNAQCNHATDPNITFQVTDTDDVDAAVTDNKQVWVRLHFLDSKDS